MHAQHEVVVPVSVEIGHRAGPRAVGGQFDAGAFPERILVHISRRLLPVILAVAEDQVHVPVFVQIVLVDALQHPGAGDVEILPAVAECAVSEIVESAFAPYPFHTLNPFTYVLCCVVPCHQHISGLRGFLSRASIEKQPLIFPQLVCSITVVALISSIRSKSSFSGTAFGSSGVGQKLFCHAW